MFEKLLEMAFVEDLDHVGDVTSDAIFDEEEDLYWLVARQEGVLCGADFFTSAFHYIDKACEVDFLFTDGNILKKGAKVASIRGPIATLLKAERVALNFIAHLSGVATQTRRYVDAVEGHTKILDTRKTLPGWREMQKYAVRCGGGSNHRMGLHDMVMIKDNHIDGVGGITQAVDRVRVKWKDRFKVEVETRNLAEVEEALEAGADVIMLDNMDTAAMASAVELVNGRVKTEASGNMTLDRIGEVSKTGVDYISVGALTHSVTVFDFSIRKIN
ncbi:MAG: carboxylating nicotinate-nucleotide diphosphorylase [Desulfobacteraceae bacterium]|nr:carboxylating nicotinate-nucleotide diphosphorylase [Desulfobacteraceae bacterium]